MSCVYSLGFYVDEYKEDDPRSVSIRINRPDMIAIHPSKYVVRSAEAQRESLLSAAWNAPDLFRTGVVRAHVFPLRPTAKDEWDVLLAVRFPVSVDGRVGQASEREFGGVLRNGPNVAHQFSRKVSVQPVVETDNLAPAFTFVDRVRLKPGEYELTVVMGGKESPQQHADRIAVVVPEVPRKELLVTGPTLGRKVGDELVFYAEGKDGGGDRQAEFGSFTPLLVQLVNEPVDLIFLTDTCFVGSPGAVRRVEQLAKSVQRDLSNQTGAGQTPIQPVPIDLEGQGKVRCQSIVDVLPASALSTGDFVFAAEVAAGKKGGVERAEVSFAVELTDVESEPR
jgi:hypothetical protein